MEPADDMEAAEEATEAEIVDESPPPSEESTTHEEMSS
jgi:hypothetical protein